MQLLNRRARFGAALGLAVAIVIAGCGDSADSDLEDQAAPSAEAGAGQTQDDGDGNQGHDHGMQPWDGPGVPTVALEVLPDPVAGWNVFAEVTDYRFAPERASTDHVPGEGHAHIYVDGAKVARVYGPAFHLASLEPGSHEISFSLSANTHSEYMADGAPLQASVTVAVPEPGESTTGHHHHDKRAWDGSAAAAVGVTVQQDPKSGWNLFVDLAGFELTPRASGTDHVPGQGHMHIYVNGQKLGRLYTAAYHLAALPAGTTEVAVRLAGNDHVEYADVEGVAVVEVAPEDSSEATTAGPADHVIEAAFMGGEVETDLARHQVSVGDVVELHVTADATDEVHVHGYDVFGDVAPGSMAMLRFVADIPGIFEVELEGSGTLLFELEVR